MAQKAEMHLEDDLDGGPAEDTIQFSLDGKDYGIDLSATNTEKRREALRPYTAASRKTTPPAEPAQLETALQAVTRTPRRSGPAPRRTATTSATVAASITATRTPTTPPSE